MQDFLKNELNVGDKIVACVGHGRNAGATLVKGEIVGFTDKFVKALIPDYTGHFSPLSDYTKVSPSKVIKI